MSVERTPKPNWVVENEATTGPYQVTEFVRADPYESAMRIIVGQKHTIAEANERIAVLEQERDRARNEAEFYLGASIHPEGRTDLHGQARQYAKKCAEVERLRAEIRDAVKMLDHRLQPAGEIEAKRILRAALHEGGNDG